MPNKKVQLTTENIEAIGKSVELGAPLKDAVQTIGLSEAWLHKHKSKGEKIIKDIEALDDKEAEKYYNNLTDVEKKEIKLVECLKKSHSAFINKNLSLIQKSANKGTWTASAWLLERRDPKNFGKRDNLELEHSGSIKTININEINPSEIEPEEENENNIEE